MNRIDGFIQSLGRFGFVRDVPARTFQWGGQVKDRFLHVFNNILSNRLLMQHQKESQKLVKRIFQNMFDELEKHREGHRLFEKLRFFKQRLNS